MIIFDFYVTRCFLLKSIKSWDRYILYIWIVRIFLFIVLMCFRPDPRTNWGSISRWNGMSMKKPWWGGDFATGSLEPGRDEGHSEGYWRSPLFWGNWCWRRGLVEPTPEPHGSICSSSMIWDKAVTRALFLLAISLASPRSDRRS